MSRDLDEDMIEATIRRVAASKAARLPDLPVGEDEADDPDAEGARGTANLYVVPPTDTDVNPEPAPDAARAPVDESLIEATLRRIEAEQTERATESARAIAQPESLDASSDVADQPVDLRGVAFADGAELQSEAGTAGAGAWESAGRSSEPALHVAHGDALEPLAFPAREESWRAAARELRRDLDDTRRQLASLTVRVDAMLSIQPQPQEAAVAHDHASAPPSDAHDDDDWDDAPQLPRIPIGTPPRPAIMRDAPPAPAMGSRSDDGDPLPIHADAAPLAAAAPLVPDAKRGFDLWPRTYRITVEDKRRGVDLVPLHRALLGMEGVRDMSLLSYSNGTAIVALEATVEIDPGVLGDAVSRAMAREVKVEVHNEQTMVIKLAED